MSFDGFSQPPPQMVAERSARGTQYLSTDEFDAEASNDTHFGEGFTVPIGGAYVTGLLGGGMYGAYHGAAISAHQKHLPKLRINAILNQTGRHGSRVGNTCGSVVLMIKMGELASKTLRGVDDSWNFAVGAAITGFLWKSPAGFGPSLTGAAFAGACAAAFLPAVRERAEGYSLQEWLPPRRSADY